MTFDQIISAEQTFTMPKQEAVPAQKCGFFTIPAIPEKEAYEAKLTFGKAWEEGTAKKVYAYVDGERTGRIKITFDGTFSAGITKVEKAIVEKLNSLM